MDPHRPGFQFSHGSSGPAQELRQLKLLKSYSREICFEETSETWQGDREGSAGSVWAHLLRGHDSPTEPQSSLDFNLPPLSELLIWLMTKVGSWWLLGTAEMFVMCWCCLSRLCFSRSVTPHRPTQGEIIWGKANACIPTWAGVGLI